MNRPPTCIFEVSEMQGGVTQALAVGRSATAVKLYVNGQGHKIALTVNQGSRRDGKFETHM